MTPAYTTLLSIVNEANPERVKQDIDLADVLMVLRPNWYTLTPVGDVLLDPDVDGKKPILLPLYTPVREWPEKTLEKIIELVKV